jgi:HD-GYP domain-containing protein (c-di-GMP phosphodiesterase class II)
MVSARMLPSDDGLAVSAAVSRRVATDLSVRAYPDEHAEAVAGLAYRVALRLGIAAETVRSVVAGGLVHDIGKLAIDATVLEKPARLNDEEWRIIRRHPHEGARLLSGVFADEVLAVVRWHHERWDGTGYPDALPGTAIPIQARVVAVADAFRAMCEKRPYRAPVATDDAVSELEHGAGTQWDPQCVAALLSVVTSGDA